MDISGNERKIVAVRRTGDNNTIQYYKLDNGDIIDTKEAVRLINHSILVGYTTGTRDAETYLRSLPDKTRSNNLQSMPEF